MPARLSQTAREAVPFLGQARASYVSAEAPPRAPATPATAHSAPFVARAATLSVAWVVGALPALLGVARCPSARLLHVPCPGCGMQRAAHLFLHGDLRASFAMNPLAVPIALATLAVALATVLLTLKRGTPMGLLESRPARAAVIAFVALEVLSVVVWALRFAGLFGGPVPV
jgi:Protein of unknown function (DUF2752)